jgi:anaerobic selenocysteine-containing dehydrogenase
MTAKSLRSICQFCHTNCGIIFEKSSDGTLSVTGDPDHPVNRGALCPKAAAIPEMIHSKDRLRYPLKKTSTGFKKISWDEALSLAAQKLGEIRTRFGPASLLRCTGAPVSYQGRDGFLEFMGAFGSPNLTGAANLCMLPRMTAFKAVTGAMRPEPDYDHTRLTLFWGTNPLASDRFGAYTAYNGYKQILPGLKKRGVRIIVIDPYRTKLVGQADQWVKIRPGADIALGLAMIHVIIRDALYNKTFVENYTTGFDALSAHVHPLSPAWAAPLTGISEKAITDLATVYATTKPATIYEGNGLDMYVNGVDAVRTVATLIALTGNLDAPGGNILFPFVRQSPLPTQPAARQERLWFDRLSLFPEVPFPAVKASLMAGEKKRPRAMIVHHANPVLVQANEKKTRQALAKLDFLMVTDIFPTATTEMADLVLPVTSDFESYGYRAYSSSTGGFVALGRPVADPVGASRPVFEVEYELAQRLQLHTDYPFHDTRSWLEFMLKPSGITLAQLENEQLVFANDPVKYRKYESGGFDTPSGKVEFYSKWFEDGGVNPLPAYALPAGEPLQEKNRAAKGFPLLASSRRPSRFVHTKFKNLETLTAAYPTPLVWIHPTDAAQRGIESGQDVAVSSPQGEIVLKTMLSENTDPGLIWIDFGWGNPTDGKASINVLVNDAFYDPVSGGTPNRLFPCEVKSQKKP